MSTELINLAVLLPGADKLEGHNVWRGFIRTPSDQLHAYIKRCNTRDLVVEALCASLAKKLGLPIASAYLVRIPALKLPDVVTEEIGFALEDGSSPSISARMRDASDIRNTILRWSDLVACAAFDSWIGNDDRLPHNLLYDGGESFQLIDHGEALKEYLSPSGAPKNELLSLASKGMFELDKQRLFNELREYLSVIQEIDWVEIRQALLLCNRTYIPKDVLDPMLQLLQDRLPNLPTIFTQQLGIRQLDLYDSRPKKSAVQTFKPRVPKSS